MQEYKIITSGDWIGMEQAVNGALKEGWILQGGLIYCDKLLAQGAIRGKVEPTKPKCMPLSELSGVDVGSLSTLRFVGVKTTDDLIKLSPVDLLKLPSIGKLRLRRIEHALNEHGLSLRGR